MGGFLCAFAGVGRHLRREAPQNRLLCPPDALHHLVDIMGSVIAIVLGIFCHVVCFSRHPASLGAVCVPAGVGKVNADGDGALDQRPVGVAGNGEQGPRRDVPHDHRLGGKLLAIPTGEPCSLLERPVSKQGGARMATAAFELPCGLWLPCLLAAPGFLFLGYDRRLLLDYGDNHLNAVLEGRRVVLGAGRQHPLYPIIGQTDDGPVAIIVDDVKRLGELVIPRDLPAEKVVLGWPEDGHAPAHGSLARRRVHRRWFSRIEHLFDLLGVYMPRNQLAWQVHNLMLPVVIQNNVPVRPWVIRDDLSQVPLLVRPTDRQPPIDARFPHRRSPGNGLRRLRRAFHARSMNDLAGQLHLLCSKPVHGVQESGPTPTRTRPG
mmetsp:Transcript_5154/g.14755  ORF Transcript_5154/g.14755 Transcript_5154/m.14755 type:complete len:377 (-) Transcript_5154:1094-2224(-)